MPSKRKAITTSPKPRSSTQFIPKKMKTDTHPPPPAPSISTNKRKRPANEHDDKTSLQHMDKKAKPSPPSTTPRPTKPVTSATKPRSTKSTLVPIGPRRRALINQKDESLLHILCTNTSTATQTPIELHFRKIPHALINWTSAPHIRAINAWRNQIYGRAGLKTRSISPWHETEELWFEVYFQLSIAAARKRGGVVVLPGLKRVREAFNETFVGRVVRDKRGMEVEPRGERGANAFASKFGRVCVGLRRRLDGWVSGGMKGEGEVYVPRITVGMVERYGVVKGEMVAKGVKCEAEDGDGVEEWWEFLSRLEEEGGEGEGEGEQRGKEEEEVRELEAKEVDAVAALISLANSPVDSLDTLSLAAGVSYNAYVANDHTTPDLIHSTRTSFSQAAFDSQYTLPQDMLTFEGQAYIPDGIYGYDHDYVHTCDGHQR